MLNGMMLVRMHFDDVHFETHLISVAIKINLTQLTEEPYYASGSGSGAGVDDEDDDGGSGIGSYDYEQRVPDHTDINTSHTVTGGGPGHIDISNTTPHNGSSSTVPHGIGGGGSSGDTRISATDNNADNNKGNSASSSRLPPMSIRRALFTYLFPIYMAWFGGLFCDLL